MRRGASVKHLLWVFAVFAFVGVALFAARRLSNSFVEPVQVVPVNETEMPEAFSSVVLEDGKAALYIGFSPDDSGVYHHRIAPFEITSVKLNNVATRSKLPNWTEIQKALIGAQLYVAFHENLPKAGSTAVVNIGYRTLGSSTEKHISLRASVTNNPVHGP